jgi:hypothetical protein
VEEVFDICGVVVVARAVLVVGVIVGRLVDVAVVVGVVVVVDLAQEANISDVTMRKVSAIQIKLFFICPPLKKYH